MQTLNLFYCDGTGCYHIGSDTFPEPSPWMIGGAHTTPHKTCYYSLFLPTRVSGTYVVQCEFPASVTGKDVLGYLRVIYE